MPTKKIPWLGDDDSQNICKLVKVLKGLPVTQTRCEDVCRILEGLVEGLKACKAFTLGYMPLEYATTIPWLSDECLENYLTLLSCVKQQEASQKNLETVCDMILEVCELLTNYKEIAVMIEGQEGVENVNG